MFENKLIRGIHVSRYVASFYNVCDNGILMERWLNQLIIDDAHLTEEEVRYIVNFAMNGKLELEIDCKNFLKKNEF